MTTDRLQPSWRAAFLPPLVAALVALVPAPSATANQVGVIPNATGVTKFEFPCLTGITVLPGSGQTLSVAYT